MIFDVSAISDGWPPFPHPRKDPTMPSETIPADPALRRAPVQDRTGIVTSIPWEMHLRAYAVYCKKWRPQPALIDLAGRNCRGGFSTGELDDFIPGWREELPELEGVSTKLAHALQRIAALEVAKADAEEALAVVRQSLAEQAAARIDPTMPLLVESVVEALRADAEATYACADTIEDRIRAHGLFMLCDWQDARRAARTLTPEEARPNAEGEG